MEPIPGFLGIYAVDREANVWSAYKQRYLQPIRMRNGYHGLCLCLPGGERKHYLVHRLVAQTFIPNPDNKPVVNHLNGNKLDNRVENLQWCTESENKRHAMKLGLCVPPPSRKGMAHTRVKMTDDAVIDMRRMYASGVTQKALAQRFGVSRSTVHQIVNHRIWQHLPGLKRVA